MKKLLSIMLAMLIAVTAFFSLSASAAEENRSVKFLKDVIASKTLGVDVDTSSLAGGIIKNVQANVKLGDKIQVAGTAKLPFGIKARLFVDGSDITAYLGLFKLNISEVIPSGFDLGSIGADVSPIFEKADEVLKYLEYKPNLSSANEDVLGINKAEVLNTVCEEAAKKGTEISADDLNTKTVAELCDMAGIDNEATKQYLCNLENAGAHFIYDEKGSLKNIKIELPDENGEIRTFIDTNDLGGLKIKSLSTNLNDKAFKQPVFGLGVTWIAKLILGPILSNLL